MLKWRIAFSILYTKASELKLTRTENISNIAQSAIRLIKGGLF